VRSESFVILELLNCSFL